MNSSFVDPYLFQPEISDVSKVIAEKSEMYQGGLKDFQTRQSEFLERQREKREKLRNQYSEDAAHSFQPRINLTSEVICASDPNREAETPEERFARMSQQASLKQKVQRELNEQELYKDYTFKPKINAISARIAPETSIIERSMNNEIAQRKELIRKEIEDQQEKNCTFKPQINLSKKQAFE